MVCITYCISLVFFSLQGCVCCIFASLFFTSKTRPLVKLGKMLFISLQKLFLFLRKSNFSILDFQLSWCHSPGNSPWQSAIAKGFAAANSVFIIITSAKILLRWSFPSKIYIQFTIFNTSLPQNKKDLKSKFCKIEIISFLYFPVCSAAFKKT